MSPAPLDPARPVTRRSLLQAGAATGALLALGGPGGASALAAGAPAHLRRSGYAGLTGSAFAATGTPVTLRLAEITDLARAVREPSFAGHDDAFALLLTGPAGPVLEQGVHELRHAALGRFPLFLTPVGPAGDVQAYEVVVDRSVPFGDATDAAPEPLALSTAAPVDPGPAAGSGSAPAGTAPASRAPAKKRGRVLRAAVARRGGVLSADVRVNRARRLVTVQVALVRDDVVLARGAARLRGRGAVRVRLRERRRVPAGEYTLVVSTRNRDGRNATTRRRAWLSR